jgi:repressor LexA
MHPRTKRQKDVLDFITGYVSRNGHEPSYQQIARQLGVSSKAGIAKHIQALESQGLISRRRENGSFGLQLPHANVEASAACRIEFFERAAGRGEESAWRRSHFVIAAFVIGSLEPDDVFAFKVPDDSMIEKDLYEEDIVLFERRAYARRGEIVIAKTDDENLIFGQFFHNGTESEIRPSNAEYETQSFDADRIAIQGVMRGLVRPIPALMQ